MKHQKKMGKKNLIKLLFKFFLLLIPFNLIFAACNTPSPMPDMPEIGISEDEFNTKVRLSAPAGWNTFKTDDIIGLEVEVISEEPVVFQNDYGARLFLWNNGQWLEVDDDIINPEGEIVVYPSTNDPWNGGSTGVGPNLPDPDKPARVRIIIIGNVYRDNESTDERVAAYIDVYLTP